MTTIEPAAIPAIRIDHLNQVFGSQTAVSDLSLDVPVGSVYGLLGENGAGKTTTIQVLLGLLAPTSGRTIVLGLDPAVHGQEVRRRVGYVPEVPALYDWMTVAEIGWFAAGFHPDCPGGPFGYEARFKDFADNFQLPPKRKIRQLSKGMRAKVSLALALSHDPALLILDEPTSGLDTLVRREFLESMVDLAASGRTVFLSSHQIGEVERVASHIALLHQGKLLLAEPLETLRSRTFQASLTFADRNHPSAPAPGTDIELIDAFETSRQAQWLLHAPSRTACESYLRSLPRVESMRIETPSLEEIYVGYMRRRRPTGTDAPASQPPRPAIHVA
jgi:ABC-2 type transport system ATP-binding protein